MTLERVKGLTTTNGTGAYTVVSAGDAAYADMITELSDGDLVDYCCQEPGVGFEVGRGIWTAAGNTLSRLRVTKSSNSDALVIWAGGTSKEIFVCAPEQSLSLGRGKTDGLITRNNSTTPATKVDVLRGVCRSDDDTQNLWNDVDGFICSLAGPWAEGTDQPKMIVGPAPAVDTTYHLWMWGRVGPTVTQQSRLLDTDFSWDTSPTAPVAPGPEWIFKQLIWSVRTLPSVAEVMRYNQNGDWCDYVHVDSAGADVNNRIWAVSTMSTTETIPTGMPKGLKYEVKVGLNFQATFGSGNNVNREIIVSDPDSPAPTPGASLYDIRIRAQSTDDPARSENVEVQRTTNTNAELRIAVSHAPGTGAALVYKGFKHPRGSNQG